MENKENIIFETASFHIVKPCNMKCKFCYATFDDQRVLNQLDINDTKDILLKLKESGLQKITFAGGEPMLYKNIDSAILYSKEIGLVTSIITNGSFITPEWLDRMKGVLDWIGISVDSLDVSTNTDIGRVFKGNQMDYYTLVDAIKSRGFKLKINTVVNRFNKNEDMSNFLNYATPERWKVFQALRVDGQNDAMFESVRVTDCEFIEFVTKHIKYNPVDESNEKMTGSYLLIDPQGRLFENSKGTHTYSDKLQESTVKECVSQLDFNREMFIKRDGLYIW